MSRRRKLRFRKGRRIRRYAISRGGVRL
ncbi:hypothetical protein [Dipodfec virus RodF1_76]|uniref:Uncharacterized protein n=1 Tax=Dipodfec virus RodF1_76 TaxID=2929311 RepID=A0A976R8W8_9VIRU|nr:hypothetical protein [Dipodfec virus RodF1_76]